VIYRIGKLFQTLEEIQRKQKKLSIFWLFGLQNLLLSATAAVVIQKLLLLLLLLQKRIQENLQRILEDSIFGIDSIDGLMEIIKKRPFRALHHSLNELMIEG